MPVLLQPEFTLQRGATTRLAARALGVVAFGDGVIGGGIPDLVVDAAAPALADRSATGFAFDAATPAAFEQAVRRAIGLRADAAAWRGLMATAMAQSMSWAGPARAYLDLYGRVIGAASARPV